MFPVRSLAVGLLQCVCVCVCVCVFCQHFPCDDKLKYGSVFQTLEYMIRYILIDWLVFSK